MKTTYVVSGYMRTGTSMMMNALSSGGLDPAFNKARDNMNGNFGDKDYKPNPNGFYELSRSEYQETGFPEKYHGKLLKCLFGGIPKFCKGKYKIVFMKRDPEEIRQSYEGFFNKELPLTPEKYEKIVENTVGIMSMRQDMEYIVLNYRDVVDDPEKAFKKLKNFGFPINIEKATAVVNKDLCRFKKENLTIGI